MKTVTAFLVAIVAGLVLISAATVGWTVSRGAAVAAASAHRALPTEHLYLTVATPDMLGTDVGPALLPSNLTVPAGAEVTVTVANFDGNTPLVGSGTKYARATGIAGGMTCRPLDPKNPNAASSAKGVTSTAVDPNTVSHTFTVDSLGLNVPICGSCQTTFTFFSGARGRYTWRCMDPCGTGPTGWDGAMAKDGYMQGVITVV